MRCVNVSFAECMRSGEQIWRLQRQHREIAEDLVSIVRIRPDTKIHRTVLHLGEALTGFGTVRDMDTDENESLNKNQKKFWHVTNG